MRDHTMGEERQPLLEDVSRLSWNYRERRQAALAHFLDKFFGRTSPFASMKFELFFFTQLPVVEIEQELQRIDFGGAEELLQTTLRDTESRLLAAYVPARCDPDWMDDACIEDYEKFAESTLVIPDSANFPGHTLDLPPVPETPTAEPEPEPQPPAEPVPAELTRKRSLPRALRTPSESSSLHPSESLPSMPGDWDSVRQRAAENGRVVRRLSRMEQRGALDSISEEVGAIAVAGAVRGAVLDSENTSELCSSEGTPVAKVEWGQPGTSLQ